VSYGTGDTHYVDLDGAHNHPFTNWVDAATNISSALLAASPGDQVLVETGTYYIVSEILITQDIHVASTHGRDHTIIDGMSNVRCVYLGAAGSHLEGFTVRNGYGLGDGPGGPDRHYGGGVLCATGTVSHCRIVSNVGYYGGGISCWSNGLVRGCLVEGNTGENGAGGVNCWGGTVASSIIRNNSGYSGGAGGIGCHGGHLASCIVSGNTGPGIAAGAATIVNCTVVSNTTVQEAGGVLLVSPSQITNAIVFNNAPSNYATLGAGSTLWSYSCTTPMPPGTGNITNAPMLTPTYRLKSTSPCIDAGTSSNAPATDIDGEARWDHPGHPNIVSIVDIGADEFVDADGDNMADFWEIENLGHTTNSNGTTDGDTDDLNDLAEYENGTHPGNPDTDADEMPDGWEVEHDLDPRSDDSGQDADSDTMNNGGEYAADTDPRNPESLLSILDTFPQLGGIRVDWKGGEDAWQFLECSADLISNQWDSVLAIPPPTPVTNAVIDFGMTNQAIFYRIRAVR
jgi:hypothetical protein